jgi:hypothetical protein
MSKFWGAILIIILTSIGSYAQPPGDKQQNRAEARERIHAAKMVYVTDRLHLTAAQSADFLSVYNEYDNEIRDLRRSYFKKYKGIDPADAAPATSRQFIDDNLDYQQDVIAVKRKYNDRFLKVISAQQLIELNKAEREFRQMLEKRLKERQQLRR